MNSLVEERFKVTCLERMIHLVALLVENSRKEQALDLSTSDMDLLIGSRVSLFIVIRLLELCLVLCVHGGIITSSLLSFVLTFIGLLFSFIIAFYIF